MIPKNLKARRRQPDATKVKKHSAYSKKREKRIVVGGARQKTDTGFRVPGFAGKSFETFYEVMLPGTSTPTLLHPKKDRTIRVMAGSAFVVISRTLDDGTVDTTQRRVIAGDEVALERGLTYRIATANEQLELVVCQQAKYEASLEVSDDGIIRDVTPDMLRTPTPRERLVEMRPADVRQTRKGSKAKQQMIAARGGRTSAQVEAIANVSGASAPEYAGTASGLNAKPTGGRFDDAGAG